MSTQQTLGSSASRNTASGPVARTVAGRRHQTWESRFKRGLGEAGEASDKISRGTGWEILSYLLAGMTVYGGVGWVIGHFTHIQILFPIGMVIGLAISLSWVVYRFGRK